MAKETAQPKDQSMEEILQSIKRIIAEEGTDTGKSANGADHGIEDLLVKGSDVLELQDLSEAPAPAAEVLELTEEIEEPAVGGSSPSPVVQLRGTLENDGNRDVLADIDSLLSEDAAKASAAALRALSQAGNRRELHRNASPALRSGLTVEDLVVEALKPMLKEWLDHNLPELVQQLVEKEIRKLTS
jgi:cell pole-organizing protein PopZ